MEIGTIEHMAEQKYISKRYKPAISHSVHKDILRSQGLAVAFRYVFSFLLCILSTI